VWSGAAQRGERVIARVRGRKSTAPARIAGIPGGSSPRTSARRRSPRRLAVLASTTAAGQRHQLPAHQHVPRSRPPHTSWPRRTAEHRSTRRRFEPVGRFRRSRTPIRRPRRAGHRDEQPTQGVQRPAHPAAANTPGSVTDIDLSRHRGDPGPTPAAPVNAVPHFPDDGTHPRWDRAAARCHRQSPAVPRPPRLWLMAEFIARSACAALHDRLRRGGHRRSPHPPAPRPNRPTTP